ncbi:MAG: hypothetical protein ISS15_05370 [Alphaproteobacteria bacterium]|nr:hypothetical protein [Alphaproteobacteria bacterium]MBL7097069.1 hypothetical protein [Alphaproteobacteria bacterium]
MARRRSGLSPLAETLITSALNRTAYVLRPYPKDVTSEDLETALADLRARGYVHGTRREPNLTPTGAEAARALTTEDAD